MKFAAIAARPLEIPFKVAFRHASAERSKMQSMWVEVRSAKGTLGVGEGCPREYVTGESLATALAFVETHRNGWLREIADIHSLYQWMHANEAEVDRNPAAWSAVEIGYLDCMGQEGGLPIEALIGTPSVGGVYTYSAVIGDGPQAAFEKQLGEYARQEFRSFKIKLSGDAAKDQAKVAALRAAKIPAPAARADANNLFKDARTAIDHLAALDYPFFAIEEPLSPGDYEGMREISRALGVSIILDESIRRTAQLEALRPDAARWIANVRISKMGGVGNSRVFVDRAKEIGVRVIVGAHVGESSILTRCGIMIATHARSVLVAQEGAFGTHLLERDPVAPCLMFKQGGRLQWHDYVPMGNGLGVKPVPAAQTKAPA